MLPARRSSLAATAPSRAFDVAVLLGGKGCARIKSTTSSMKEGETHLHALRTRQASAKASGGDVRLTRTACNEGLRLLLHIGEAVRDGVKQGTVDERVERLWPEGNSQQASVRRASW